MKEPIASQKIPTTQRTPLTENGKASHFGKRQIVILFSGAAVLIVLLGLTWQLGKLEGARQESTTQTPLDENAPVIIQQSLKPSGTVGSAIVVDPKSAVSPQNPSLLHQSTTMRSPESDATGPLPEAPKTAPEATPEINSASREAESKPSEALNPARKMRSSKHPLHRRSLLKKAFQILEKAF